MVEGFWSATLWAFGRHRIPFLSAALWGSVLSSWWGSFRPPLLALVILMGIGYVLMAFAPRRVSFGLDDSHLLSRALFQAGSVRWVGPQFGCRWLLSIRIGIHKRIRLVNLTILVSNLRRRAFRPGRPPTTFLLVTFSSTSVPPFVGIYILLSLFASLSSIHVMGDFDGFDCDDDFQ